MEYVHIAPNKEQELIKENNVLVLYWISKKKKGYDRTTNKFPKWFFDTYEIDFNNIMENYIKQGFLSDDDNIVKITDRGEKEIKKYDYVVYIFEHPQYCLSINDYNDAGNLHKVQNSDIAWGIFNYRLTTYIQNKMWSSLAANYGNMADLLVEEKKYEQALDFIFASAFIGTSGMQITGRKSLQGI